MARNFNKCPHIENVIQLSLPELCKLKQGLPCSQCSACGPNLWICLHRNCLHIGCSEQANDHSTEHFKLNNSHCIHMNLSSQRIWCYLCGTEVFITQRRPSLVSNSDSYDRFNHAASFNGSNIGDTPDTSCDEDESGDRNLMNGLVGLQNIANTCYMNAALQALSNTPPLTYYFLDCADIIDAISELPGNQRKPGLARSYQRLIKEMWARGKKSSAYVVPRGILYGIRSVHPMFRGFQQHDTQEFLRCFMDQLHEELKEATSPPPDVIVKQQKELQHHHESDEHSEPSQSEAEEYETCDSGVSEQSSLSDEINANSVKKSQYTSRSPSPPSLINQKSINSNKTTFVSQSNITSGQQQQQQQQTLQQSQQSGQTNSQSSAATGQGDNNLLPKLPHRSIISDVFDGKLLSAVQCLTCDRVSTREETFQDLSLPIPGKDHLAVLHHSQNGPQTASPTGVSTCTDAVYQVGQDGWFWWVWNWFRSWFWGPAVSLHDCMAAFFSADELKGDNMYSCEKCNKLRNGIKYSRVLALPEVLCVHLKRFRHDLSYSSKISSPVHFPLTGLDMRPYLHKDCKSEISTYDLTAVICHHGTVGGGHYTSFAKHELTGKWFEFDDQLVTPATPEMVQNCQAYVLFYRKANPQMAITRAHAQQLAETNPPQASDIRFFVSRQWINRFNTFAEPGPIDNWAILCPHGGLPPCKAGLIGTLALPLPQVLWDFLYKKFGGGPACNRLFECDTCRRAAESLSRRQEIELEAFTKLNNDFQFQDPTTIYAISMAWFRQWQSFARGNISTEPGPINNSTIAGTSETTPIRSVRSGSDYAQLNATLWKFFHSIYGGGPEIILRGDPVEDFNTSTKDKEPEYMDVEQDLIKNQIKRETIEKIESRPPISSTTVKQTKNVSFEDEQEDTSVDNNSRKSSDDTAITTSTNSASRRARYSGSHNDVTTIINKKDKKYRSAIKSTNSMFGPEGKYQTQNDNIPDSHSFKQTQLINTNNPISNSNNPCNIIPYSSQSQFQVTSNSSPQQSMKRSIPLLMGSEEEEVTPLIQLDSQASTIQLETINQMNSLESIKRHQQDKSQNVKKSNSNYKSSTTTGKRKKFKSKNSRKPMASSASPDQESD